MRSGPNENSEALATGAGDEPVEMLEYGRTWCKVRFKGKEGYMATKFLLSFVPECRNCN